MTPNWNVVTGSPSTVRFTYATNTTGWYPTKWYQRDGQGYREVPAPSVPLPWVQTTPEPYVPSGDDPFVPYAVDTDDYEETPVGGANPYVYPFAPFVYPIIPEVPCEPSEPKPLKRRRPGVPEEGEAETPLDERMKHVLEDL